MDKRSALRAAFELHDQLNTLILSWDPYGLVAAGELPDEFSWEDFSILKDLPDCDSEADVAHLISRVFSESFSAGEFPVSRCGDIGRIVHAWWESRP